jgi:hypothetical protein
VARAVFGDAVWFHLELEADSLKVGSVRDSSLSHLTPVYESFHKV